MTQYATGPKTFTAGEDLAAFRRVKLSSSTVVYADQADSTSYLGVTMNAVSSGDLVTVRLKNAEGTFKCVAADTFSAGAALYAADDGKVSDSSSGSVIGTALEAATAAGDVVEVILDLGGAAYTFPRTTITMESLVSYNIPLTHLRTWDALATNLPATAANDDLALITGTPGTDAPCVKGADIGGTTGTYKAGFLWSLPAEYSADDDVKVRINANMQVICAGSGAASTIDVSAYRTAAPTVDICATAAQSINSATAADKDFVLTDTDLAPGEMLFIVITAAATDGDNSAANINAVINSVEMLLDIRG